MKLLKRNRRKMPFTMSTLLMGAAGFALFTFLREAPDLRRYFRISRM